jgi:transcriptional regulator of acetoin/glycerol metabolism
MLSEHTAAVNRSTGEWTSRISATAPRAAAAEARRRPPRPQGSDQDAAACSILRRSAPELFDSWRGIGQHPEVRRAAWIMGLPRSTTAKLGRMLQSEGVPEFIGDSPAIRVALDLMKQAAPTDASVLILRESGTGKGLLARTLHALSPRRRKPFLDVHCGALADDFLERQLFGHDRGAFTDAINGQPGLFELADGGTLFLDGLAEMSPEMQEAPQGARGRRVSARGGRPATQGWWPHIATWTSW